MGRSKNISNNEEEKEKLDWTLSKEEEFDSEDLYRGDGKRKKKKMKKKTTTKRHR